MDRRKHSESRKGGESALSTYRWLGRTTPWADGSVSSTPDLKETLTWPDTEEDRLTGLGSRGGPGGLGRGRGVTKKGEKPGTKFTSHAVHNSLIVARPQAHSQLFNVARFLACNIEKLELGPGDKAMNNQLWRLYLL